MLLIPCPHCGLREESEFSYGGPAREVPPLDAAPGVAQQALYKAINPGGPLAEMWYHASGCECWITVTRDTRSHAMQDQTE